MTFYAERKNVRAAEASGPPAMRAARKLRPVQHYPFVGSVYNRWTIVGSAAKHLGRRDRRWLCRCECGAEKEINGFDLHSGKNSSCGCRKAEVNRAVAAARVQ